MFPQLPFGFQNNVRLYQGTSSIQVDSLSLSSFIGEVKAGSSNTQLDKINLYSDIQTLKYSEALLDINNININSSAYKVNQSLSDLSVSNININTITNYNLVYWTPANTATELWLDASDASTITLVSSAVSEWNDKSGNNRHTSQSNSAKRPVIAAAALNGLNGISFDGVDDFLETSSYISVNSPGSNSMVFVVSESSGSARYGVIGTRNNAGTDTGWLLSYFSSTQNPLLAFIGIAVNSATGSVRTPDIIGFVKTGSTLQATAFLNTVGTASAGTLNPVTTGRTYIGVEDNLQSFPLLGKIYEIIEITTNSVDIRQRTEGYLAHKWGLTSNLPSDHPYKTSPPMV